MEIMGRMLPSLIIGKICFIIVYDAISIFHPQTKLVDSAHIACSQHMYTYIFIHIFHQIKIEHKLCSIFLFFLIFFQPLFLSSLCHISRLNPAPERILGDFQYSRLVHITNISFSSLEPRTLYTTHTHCR